MMPIRVFSVLALLLLLAACEGEQTPPAAEEKPAGRSGPLQQKSDKDVVALHKKAAEAGETGAQYALAGMYERGLGVEQSDEKALEWRIKAAEGGHAAAQYQLGRMHAYMMNLPEAYIWFELAARSGDSDAARERDELKSLLDQETLSRAGEQADSMQENYR